MNKDKFTLITAQIIIGCFVLAIVALTLWLILWLFTQEDVIKMIELDYDTTINFTIFENQYNTKPIKHAKALYSQFLTAGAWFTRHKY